VCYRVLMKGIRSHRHKEGVVALRSTVMGMSLAP
jgi:hypothetical protein